MFWLKPHNPILSLYRSIKKLIHCGKSFTLASIRLIHKINTHKKWKKKGQRGGKYAWWKQLVVFDQQFMPPPSGDIYWWFAFPLAIRLFLFSITSFFCCVASPVLFLFFSEFEPWTKAFQQSKNNLTENFSHFVNFSAFSKNC